MSEGAFDSGSNLSLKRQLWSASTCSQNHSLNVIQQYDGTSIIQYTPLMYLQIKRNPSFKKKKGHRLLCGHTFYLELYLYTVGQFKCLLEEQTVKCLNCKECQHCIHTAGSERSTAAGLPIRVVSALKVLKSQWRGSFRDIVLMSLSHITGQCSISHIPTRAQAHTHTHRYTLKHRVEITQIILPISCVLICLLLLFSASKHVPSCCLHFHVHTCSV